MQKILVVDDELLVRKAIVLLLEKNGYEARTANNGREGVKEYTDYQPDLVLTDIAMPDMEGIEFLRILRKRKEDLPIIVMSGNIVGQKFLTSARLFGAKVVLEKPFTKEDLLSTVGGCLL
jgi:CheY-like chemotaxis protein